MSSIAVTNETASVGADYGASHDAPQIRALCRAGPHRRRLPPRVARRARRVYSGATMRTPPIVCYFSFFVFERRSQISRPCLFQSTHFLGIARNEYAKEPLQDVHRKYLAFRTALGRYCEQSGSAPHSG